MQMLLSNSQAGPGRTVKQEQEEISRNHIQSFICLSECATTSAAVMSVPICKARHDERVTRDKRLRRNEE